MLTYIHITLCDVTIGVLSSISEGSEVPDLNPSTLIIDHAPLLVPFRSKGLSYKKFR